MADPSPPLPPSALHGARVLVVEDDPATRRALSRRMTRLGATVREAVDGRSGLAQATAEGPDVIVLDLGLPDLHGVAVCRELRRHPTTARTPVLVLTGHGDVTTQLDALTAGADDFVIKPAHPKVVEARLGNLVRRHRAELENARLVRDLERYLSQAAREQALEPRAMERLRATILFSDLRDSTAASFAGEPQAYAEAVRTVLGRQADIIRHWGGYVDKFTGDGMLAVFSDEQGPLQACQAAAEIVRWARVAPRTGIWHPLPIGIGIHEGMVLRGDVGSDNRRDFTVLGPTVNTAARLCGHAGALDVLVSQTVFAGAPPAQTFRSMPPLVLKGLPAPLRAWRMVVRGAVPAPSGGTGPATG